MLGLHGPRLRQLGVSLKRAQILLKDSWALLLSSIAVVVYMKIDQIMLGQMVGDEAVGIYSAAVRVSEVWYFIPTTIVASVFPAPKRENLDRRNDGLRAPSLSDALLFVRLLSVIETVE